MGDTATKEIFEERDNQGQMPFGGVLHYIGAGAGETIPPWWSQGRDIALRNFAKDGDHIAGTINTLHDMMITIPFKVIPRDTTVKSHIKQADEFTRILMEDTQSRSSLISQGWGIGFGSFVNDYHTTDNGAWFVVDGPGQANQPVMGAPTRLIHLDSVRVWRTGSGEFPIIFNDIDGKRHVVHFTRVINLTSNPDSSLEMYGIGFCAVSRAMKAAQNLMDIANYKLEKLGSRPKRAIMAINTAGQQRRAVQAVKNALGAAEMGMDTKGLTRFSQIPIVGINGEITMIDLASLPDGFNEIESTQLGVFVLAMAFGVDVRQLGFALNVTGQTKADAEVQHLKMRGKGPGTILQETERLINSKFLPPHLKLIFDWQDDSQDLMQANIQEKRSITRKANLENGSTTVRVEREKMVINGEISQEQFIEMELKEGRLSDGTSILALFESTDRRIMEYLDLGVDDPLDIELNDTAVILPEIKAAIADIQALIIRSVDLQRTRQSLEALEVLQRLYEQPEQIEQEAVRLSPNQLRSVTQTLRDVASGDVSESTALDLIESVGIREERAKRMVQNALANQSTTKIIEEEDGTMLGKFLKEVNLGKFLREIKRNDKSKEVRIVLPSFEIPITMPEINMPDVIVPEQPAPIVNIPKQEPPKVEVIIPQQPEPNITINVPEVKVPETRVEVNIPETKQATINPQIIVEVPETETEIIRDTTTGLIKKTIKRKVK